MYKDARIGVFAYVNAPEAGTYRAILRVFAAAKAAFRLHLRPDEILTELSGSGAEPGLSREAVDRALAQLCSWGNLEAQPDTGDVSTVEEFYRARLLYQLTREGEAAERAIQHYTEQIETPGELQTAALADIRVMLEELAQLAEQTAPDGGKVHRTLRELESRFGELTGRASTFLSSLHRAIDLRGIEVDAFVSYKHNLIDYLERFVGELVVTTATIVDALTRVEHAGVEPLLELAAAREQTDTLDAGDGSRGRAVAAWRSRWAGLRSWFVGDAAGMSQAELLRARTRSAIPALLGAVAAIHERRAARSDRPADLRALARWFVQAPSDRDAHRLWRAAFALGPARHFAIDAPTVDQREAEPIAPSTSWLDAPPIWISPRLRARGRQMERPQPGKVIDRSEGKRLLAERARQEAEQAERARHRLATGHRQRMSDIGRLDPDEFGLLLDLLGEVFTRRINASETIAAHSSDGSLEIRLEPTGDGAQARIETSLGTLHGPDQFVTIAEAGKVVRGRATHMAARRRRGTAG